jgi:transcriptional regulator with XRE-family HTH domain
VTRPVQGHLIRTERQQAGIAVEQLAARTGISADTILAIESGQLEADVREANAIAETLGANVFDFYGPADKATAYRGNRSVHSAPVSGHVFEKLTAQQRRQRELEGQSDRERKQGELEDLERWHAGASRAELEEHAHAVRRLRELRTELYGSPTGQRSAPGLPHQPPAQPPESDVVWTSRGPQPVEP